MKQLFPNKVDTVQEPIAQALARVTHHLHPDIVDKIRRQNVLDAQEFKRIIPQEVSLDVYLYESSACVFPGVQRFVGRLDKRELLKYVPSKRIIVDDNRFPRHIWSFLSAGRPYSGPVWNESNLNQFELAHIFSHKAHQRSTETNLFENVRADLNPCGLFTCASNVVLIPKGLAKPTDQLDSVKRVFIKRHIALYGEDGLPGLTGFRDKMVPAWYKDLNWNDPVLIPDFDKRLELLFEYRLKRLFQIFSNPIAAQDHD